MKKNKRVILHIGTIKTGSTSIQETLGRNSFNLRKFNLYYPPEKPFNHITSFIPIFIDKPEEMPDYKKQGLNSREAKKLCDDLERYWIRQFEICDCDNFIISAETLSSSSVHQEVIKRIKKFLDRYFDEISVVLYLRHYQTMIPSTIQQMIKNGFAIGTFDELLESILKLSDSDMAYSSIIKRWAAMFGDQLIVRPFDRKVLVKGDIIHDFINAVNVSVEMSDIEMTNMNQSLGQYALSILEKFNIKYPVIKDGRPNFERALQSSHIPVHVYEKCKDIKFDIAIKYSKEQADMLNAEIDYVNKYFKNGYLFNHVKQSDSRTNFPSMQDVPEDFYLELINNYHRMIGNLKNKINQLEKANDSENEFMRKSFDLYGKNGRKPVIIFKNVILYFKCKIFGLPGFDNAMYQFEHPYSTDRAKDSLLHYLIRGNYLGYNPNSNFDTMQYVFQNPELIISGQNALIHSIRKAEI